MEIAAILLAVLCGMTMATCVFLLRTRSHSSTPSSPTPSTTPTNPSADFVTLMTTMLTTMRSTSEASARETRELVTELVLGRPQPTGTQEMLPISNASPVTYDYESTPLSPGIQAQIDREADENEQDRLQRERQELMSSIAEKTAQLGLMNGSPDSDGRWVPNQSEVDLS